VQQLLNTRQNTNLMALVIVIASILLSSLVSHAQAISENRYLARKIYNRLTGTNLPIDHPTLTEMESHIFENNLFAAAEVATRDKNFFNITVRDFASQMSTRDETIKEEFNDFTATVMGVVRDNISAKELLVGNFYYAARANITLANVQEFNRPIEDFLESNNHYRTIDRIVTGDNGAYYSLDENLPNNNGIYRKVYPHEILDRVDGQMAMGMANNANRGTVEAHPNPAGVITSRTFMAAHAFDGTNRRIVEYIFRSFTCLGIENVADNENPTDMIGRDVSREPGGENDEFKNSCQSCHTQMDSLRPAFARVNYEGNVVRWANIWNEQDDIGEWDIGDADSDDFFDPETGVINKMVRWSDAARLMDGSGDPIGLNDGGGNQRSDEERSDPLDADNLRALPGLDLRIAGGEGGSAPEDNAPIPFKLRSNNNANASTFGWRYPASQGGKTVPAGLELEGTRIRHLGQWIADSKQFSRCMVKRVFRQVCNREPTSDETDLMKDLTDEFEVRGHKLKALFQRVATRPECLGE